MFKEKRPFDMEVLS